MSTASTSPRTVVPRLGCGYAVCFVLLLIGGGLLCIASVKWYDGAHATAWWVGGVGAVCCVLAAALIGPMQRDVAMKRERLARETSRPDAPWTWEPAWTERGGIPQSGRRHGGPLGFIGVMFLLVSSPGVFITFPKEVGRNPAAWLILIFPLVGIGALAVVLRDAWRRRKYGVARFVPGAMPTPLGGELTGMVVVDRPIVANGPGRVSVDCWCTRRLNSEDTNETALAHTERPVAPRDWDVRACSSQLFVQLPLRGGAATSMAPPPSGQPSYEWRLRVETPTPGADFIAEFVLPVFDVGLPPSAELAPGTSVTKHTRRAEIWQVAGIREEPQPGAIDGHALVFPARVGRAAIGWPLAMALIVGAVAAVLWWSHAPRFVPIVASLFPTLLLLVLVVLWRGGGERVWVERDALCVVDASGAVRRLPLASFAKFERSVAVGVGTQQFYRLAARERPAPPGRFGKIFKLASLIRGEEAAAEAVTWLEERMAETG